MLNRFVVVFAAMLMAICLLLISCSEKPVELDIVVKVSLSGRPVLGARVNINGFEAGTTGLDGSVKVRTQGRRGQVLPVQAVLETPDLKSRPWSGQITISQADQEGVARYELDAALEGFVTLVARSGKKVLQDAQVLQGMAELGRTDANGEFTYNYLTWPEEGVKLTVRKPDYVEKTIALREESGHQFVADLYEQAVITIETMARNGGTDEPLAGVRVYLDGKALGKTAKSGRFSYRHEGEHGGRHTLKVVAEGYAPVQWHREINMQGRQHYLRYFDTVAFSPVRVSVYNFVANAGGAELAPVARKAQEIFERRLFEESVSFKRVPADKITGLMKATGLSLDRMRNKGWQGEAMARELDVLVTGSVSSDGDGGYLIDISFHRYDGARIISQVVEAGSDSDWRLGRAIGGVIDDIRDRYPFEGIVTAVNDDSITVNLGTQHYPLGRKDMFAARRIQRDEQGRPTGEKDVAVFEMESRRKQSSLLVPVKKGEVGGLHPGDKVVRLDRTLVSRESKIGIEVRGGVGDAKVPLSGVNVYLDGHWAGVTGLNGRLEVSARTGRSARLILYRHGFRQVNEKIDVEKEGDKFVFAMESHNSSLVLSSQPAGAEVFIDEQSIGRSPIKSPFPVPLGFHTVRVSAGGAWRDWESVIEFNDTEEKLTGRDAVVLYRDYLASARRALRKGDVKGAIAEYRKAGKEHPDYTEASHRLALLYLDEMGDYDSAIAELEKLVEVPEIRDLVFKQYAVVYTNLGHAYYAKGDSLLSQDRKKSVRYFAQAVKALEKARENMRFFPTEDYDEIAHDTWYYMAVSYHNIYVVTRDDAVLDQAELAWQQYFDFFPEKLRGRKEYDMIREAAERLWRQLQKRG